MKKMFICCATLCLALSLFCVSALAVSTLADDLDIEVSSVDASAVRVELKEGSGDPIFTVTKSSGAQSGQLYLVMIQQGTDASAKPLPTKDNLYYLNVEEATGDAFSAEAYPRAMSEGSYIVYLSDYSGSAAGAAKGVATITVGGETWDYGDVNHSGKVDNRDIRDLARYVGENPAYMEGGANAIDTSLADVNSSGQIDNRDVRDLARHVGERPGYLTLPLSA